MKALVTGASGMLGEALCPLLNNNGYEVLPTDINTTQENKGIVAGGVDYLDVREMQAVKDYFASKRPDIVFHLAAETDVDRCEKETEHAYITNTVATKNIALACQENGIPMIYISTCGVFDGKKPTPYNEFDTPNPISVYTKTKFEGEKAVQSLLNEYFIFRAGWMIGGGKKDKKFVKKIVDQILAGKDLTVVNDKKGSPTFTRDFSECIIKVVKSGRFGLYHVTNSGSASRFDIACKILELLGKKQIAINPVDSSRFPLPAPRPDSEAAESKKLSLLGIKMRPWEEALKDYLKELT